MDKRQQFAMITKNKFDSIFFFIEILYKVICFLLFGVMVVGIGWGHKIDTGMIIMLISLIILICSPAHKEPVYKILNIKIILYILLLITLFPSRFFTGADIEDFMGIDVPFLCITFTVFLMEYFSRYKDHRKWI